MNNAKDLEKRLKLYAYYI